MPDINQNPEQKARDNIDQMLVATGWNDEHAAVLFERIKAEKICSQKEKTSKRKNAA